MPRRSLDPEKNRKRIAEYIQKLEHTDVQIRRKAATKLGQLGDTAAVEPLCRALRDTDGYVRKSAAESLGLLRSPDAFAPLRFVLSSKQRGLRYAAALSLAQIAAAHPPHAGDAVNRIVEAAQKSKPEQRAPYVQALTTLGLIGVGPLCVEYNTRRSQAAHWCIREALAQMEQRLRLDVRRRLLADASLTAPQQLAVLEMLPTLPSRGWLGPWQPFDPRRYCETLAADAGESPDVRRGARGILDYLSLGRASSRYEPGEAASLLRMAGGENVPPDQGDTLMRGSEAANAPDPSRSTLLAKLRRRIGWPW